MNRLSLFLFALACFVTACKDNANEVTPVSLGLKVAFADDVRNYGFSLKNATVKLTNLTNGQTNSAVSDETGAVKFASISPGNYDIEATLTVPAADYQTVTGNSTDEDIVFNAVLKGQSILSAADNISLVLQTGPVGDWVIKQVYYAGSNTTNGASFRDQFFEIYNNSNKTLYADSLYFSQLFGEVTATDKIDLTQSYYLPSGQFDWTKAFGMTNAKANTDYVYAKAVFMIPGTGKQYPVAPGASIVIAGTALNHQAPYVGTNDKEVTIKDPSLTVDLGKADFEVYLGDYPGNTALTSDLDNPAVPNLKAIERGQNRDLVLDNLGRDAFILFKTKEDVTKWTRFASPKEPTPTASSSTYIQVPNTVIIDAVEIQPTVTTSRIPKRLGVVQDAGYSFVPNGSYSSQSIIRKTSKTVDGRKILKDTNNSTNDFDFLDKADPSKQAFK